MSAELKSTASEEADRPAVDAFALSHVGTEREQNEDACGILREPGGAVAAAVADGVSSGPGGELASALAVEVLLRDFGEAPDRPVGERLHRAVQRAHVEIRARAELPELQGMCTTLTALAVERGQLVAVHVGDSRLYLVRDGMIIQLTRDHTLAAERVRMGLLSPEKARSHPDRNMLTRSVGAERTVNQDRLSRPLGHGDVLVLCTDGLHNVLRDEDLASVVEHAAGAEAACRALVERANLLGTPDNVTVAVVRVLGEAPTPRDGLGARWRRLVGR